MFGYIRPLKDELKVREFEQFKTCYCGLCRALNKEYGAMSRFLLTYDFTFLAMLLWEGQSQPELTRAGCPVSPFRRKRACAMSPALYRSAGYSVILSWWKMKDTLEDERFFASLKDRLLMLLYKGSYRKAARLFPGFEEAVRMNLSQLRAVENDPAASLDACADKFARITASMTPEDLPSDKKRVLEQVLYHTGRFIYILDACDDLAEDAAEGRFNPLASRYDLEGGRLRGEDVEALQFTLRRSVRMICSAFELLPDNAWTSIVRNIVYLGMPEAVSRVFGDSGCAAGDGKRRRRRGRTLE